MEGTESPGVCDDEIDLRENADYLPRVVSTHL
jgi:hypothetical protein